MNGSCPVVDEAETVRLSGAVGVRTIAGACEQVRAAAATGRVMAIDLSAVSDLDITLVQLIESARRSAPPGGVRLSAPASGLLLETLQRGGFLEGAAALSFWTGAAP